MRRPKLTANLNLLALLGLATLALATTGLLVHAANRVAPGNAVTLWAAATEVERVVVVLVGLTLLACGLAPQGRRTHMLTGAMILLGVASLLAVVEHGAAILAAGGPPRARTSLGAAFWLSASALALMGVDLAQGARLGARAKALVVLAVLASACALVQARLFDGLSVVHEYRVRADMFHGELVRHVLLVALATGLSVGFGLPLGFVVTRRPVLGRRVLGVLGIIQTVPSIALFGLLIGPLSDLAGIFPALRSLGVSGIGPAPAVLALVLYGLLPVVRNAATALDGVSPAVVDAASGIGMRSSQILLKVSLPLAAPLLLSGFRIVLTQTIGLTVVAALIGAGGLGTFVFLGLGQNAMDLIMLGVIPTVALAVAADALVSAIAASIGRPG